MIQRLNVKGVPIQIQDFIFTNQRNEQRKKGCYGCGELGHFVEVYPNKPTPKTKKKACIVTPRVLALHNLTCIT